MLFLSFLMAALVAVAVPSAPARAQEVTEIVFSSGPDGSGTVQRMIDAFNDLHQGEIRVRWRQMSPENDAHHQELIDDLTLTYNRARQSQITGEIMEIISGVEALNK